MSYSTVQKDLFRHTGKYQSFPLWKGFFKPGFKYVYCMRKAANGGFFSIIYKLLLRHYSLKYGYQISYRTKIGEGFYLGHWGAIVVNPDTQIGKNCNIAQGVTIGQTNRGEKQGVPTIGDEVWIGANAIIVGGISIGNKVLIAPNAYVNEDVPDHSIVIGNPSKIIESKEATTGYINYKV